MERPLKVEEKIQYRKKNPIIMYRLQRPCEHGPHDNAQEICENKQQ